MRGSGVRVPPAAPQNPFKINDLGTSKRVHRPFRTSKIYTTLGGIPRHFCSAMRLSRVPTALRASPPKVLSLARMSCRHDRLGDYNPGEHPKIERFP